MTISKSPLFERSKRTENGTFVTSTVSPSSVCCKVPWMYSAIFFDWSVSDVNSSKDNVSIPSSAFAFSQYSWAFSSSKANVVAASSTKSAFVSGLNARSEGTNRPPVRSRCLKYCQRFVVDSYYTKWLGADLHFEKANLLVLDSFLNTEWLH